MPVYKDNKTNKWYTKFRYKDWTGVIKDKTKRGFVTKHDAVEWESEFKIKTAGELSMTFSSFVQTYKDERYPRLKPGTRATKNNIIDHHLLPYFGDKKINEITTADIVKWQTALLTCIDPLTGVPYTQSYLKTVHNQLSAIFNFAMRYYDLGKNPASIVGNMGSEKDVKTNFWTLEEYKKFSEAVMDDPLAFYCFEVLYWAGLREGELLALTRNDVDLELATITVSKTYYVINGKEYITSPKTPKSNRTVSIPGTLVEELSDYFSTIYDLKKNDRIFPVTKHFLYRHMIKGAAAAGVKKIRVHDLRHSHVSLLINMGFSAVAIADRMGHESEHITYRYAHLFPSAQTQMVTKLNNAMEDNNNVSKES